jgi:GNAT superfamily N-acetyltransferase
MCFEGTAQCPIEEVRALRRLCWPDIYAAGYSLEDEFDDHAWHWTIRMEDQLIAAARLTVHRDLVDVPDPHLFHQLSLLPVPVPIGYISRLVVHPKVRGQGLPGLLDKLRLNACSDLGCKSLVCVWNPSSGVRRRQQLMDLGFQSADGDAAQPDGGFGTSCVYWMRITSNLNL